MSTVTTSAVREAVLRTWGFDGLRPLQQEAIDAALAGRDSLVVMPTGGGKSLCYQTPPLVDGSTDVVVSPLIALMKDQVDALESRGYPAAGLHSGLEAEQRRCIEDDFVSGRYRLLFVAPERLMAPGFLDMLAQQRIARFAIDEAHCISQWGHDFRPEYRRLAVLRDRFPQASLHAFTATATPRVRDDIIAQLGLREPAVLVGTFDRPNLVYRVVPQVDRFTQTVETLRRHEGEAAIVYCLSRADTEAMSATLVANGIRAAHYHAGLDAGTRRRTQDDFSAERVDVVVATVAFGMGIDRSDVRCIIHASLPKTIENYQQETGRAGRDGLPAECLLLYSSADVMRWESLIAKSASGAEQPEAVIAAQRQLLRRMQGFASAVQCRHRALSEYFGQSYDRQNCQACDKCLGDVEDVEDATVTSQKILSCVARTGERFGVGHIVDVLQGADTDMVRRCRHQELSVYGLLKEMPKKELQNLVYQLVDQGLLGRTEGDRPVLNLNAASWEVMRGQREVHLLRPKKAGPAKTVAEQSSREGVDEGLFNHLRQWRRTLAEQRNLPPYVVFDDNTMLALARSRPTTLERLRRVRGIGDKRLTELGEALCHTVNEYCHANGVKADVDAAPAVAEIVRLTTGKKSAAKVDSLALFAQGKSIDDVMAQVQRARSTVSEYLCEYIAEKKPERIDAWVDPATYVRVAQYAAKLEDQKLRPVFEGLNSEVPYDTIRLVLAHLGTK